MLERVEVFRDQQGAYRWRRITETVRRETVAESPTGYTDKISAIRHARRRNEGVEIFDVDAQPTEPAS